MGKQAREGGEVLLSAEGCPTCARAYARGAAVCEYIRHRGRREMSVEFCGLRLAHPVINGSGTFDAIAARRAFGDALDRDFPFAAFVSKTITLATRAPATPHRGYGRPRRA